MIAAATPAAFGVVEGPGVATVASGFVIRRVPNPRYRPPLAIAPALGSGTVGPVRALDHLRGQVSHHGAPGPGRSTDWELAAGEEYRGGDALGLTLSGASHVGGSEIRRFRAEGRRGPVAASLGDVPSVAIERLLSLYGLRGGVVRIAQPVGTQWLALGGIPTPFPGSRLPRMGIGGVAVNQMAFDESRLGFALLGFGREESPGGTAGVAGLDSAGRGAAAILTWTVPAGVGRLGGTLGAQRHGLDGPSRMAVQEAIEWSLTTPELVVALRDERASRRARILQVQRFPLAARREQRWNVQTRWFAGRGETHFLGVLHEGGDSDLASRTVQLGASAAPGSGWYCGTDAVWDRRGAIGAGERRLSLHAGGSGSGGHAFLARAVWAASPDRDALAMEGEASLALSHGARLVLEPRLAWGPARLEQGSTTLRISWPLPWVSGRLAGGLTVSAERDARFRGTVREAEAGFSWAPRPSDRADLEVRRLDQAGRPVMEYNGIYEARIDRYESPAGWFAARDSGRLVVRVVRSGDRAGVPDVLISLDGKELRFTDADGVVRFGHVAAGVHVVAVEERSLPVHYQVVGTARGFVTLERDVATPITVFEVARRARRLSF